MEERCIMPEMPYCPACEYGYIEYLNETDTIWHCMVDDYRKSEKMHLVVNGTKDGKN